MNLHLQEISTQVTPGAIAALLCDRAGWHQTGRELEVPDNIVLLPFPAYSPELNPMENVWEFLRANKLFYGVKCFTATVPFQVMLHSSARSETCRRLTRSETLNTGRETPPIFVPERDPQKEIVFCENCCLPLSLLQRS